MGDNGKNFEGGWTEENVDIQELPKRWCIGGILRVLASSVSA
jgi:hypothetical protein